MKRGEGMKWIHTMILAFCVLICAFLIGRVVFHSDVPLHTPNTVVQRAAQTETEATRKITLDSGAGKSVGSNHRPGNFMVYCRCCPRCSVFAARSVAAFARPLFSCRHCVHWIYR